MISRPTLSYFQCPQICTGKKFPCLWRHVDKCQPQPIMIHMMVFTCTLMMTQGFERVPGNALWSLVSPFMPLIQTQIIDGHHYPSTYSSTDAQTLQPPSGSLKLATKYQRENLRNIFIQKLQIEMATDHLRPWDVLDKEHSVLCWQFHDDYYSGIASTLVSPTIATCPVFYP